MEKPSLTPPELRRKKAEIDGRLKAKEDESSQTLVDFSAEGRVVTDAEWTKADGLTAEILSLRKLSDAFGRQVEAADRWKAVDDDIDRSKDGEGRLDRDQPHNDSKNTHGGRHQYSMLKAWRSKMDPSRYKLDGLELEVHQEMSNARNSAGCKAARGVMVPLDLPVDRQAAQRWASRSGVKTAFMRYEDRMRREAIAEGRDLTGGLNLTAGAGSIPTILDTTMIELLRARMVTFNLGARVLTDMQGLFAIPRQSTASTFYMVGQGVNITTSNQTIDQVPFSPHTGGVNTTYTRQLLEQTNQDAEMFVREDHAAVVARGVETAGLNGQGALGYPLGLCNNQLIPVYVGGTNGAAPSWAQLVAQEAYPAYFNADVGSLAYVTDALIRGTLKSTAKIGSTYPIYLWNTEAPDYPVNGYPCGVTNLLPQNIQKGSGSNLHAMIFGNWTDLIYAFWSGMDTIVDPYTQAANGGVVITTLQDFDVNVRHPQSFSNCVDIISGITAPVA